MDIGISINKDGTVSISAFGESHRYPIDRCGEYLICRNVFAGKFPTGKRIWPMNVLYWPSSGHIAIEEGGYAHKGGARIIIGWYEQSLGSKA